MVDAPGCMLYVGSKAGMRNYGRVRVVVEEVREGVAELIRLGGCNFCVRFFVIGVFPSLIRPFLRSLR